MIKEMYFNRKETAAYLKISVRTVDRLLSDGRIKVLN